MNDTIYQLFETSINKRSHLLDANTDALRLFDGIGDGIDGIFLETFADRWLLSSRTSHLPPQVRDYMLESGRTVYWKRLDQHQKESPSHLAGPAQDEAFTAKESGIDYKISFQSGYSQGIFLDQRENRKRVRQRATSGQRVLNTFAYTGAFSVSAAMGGATTSTLDLSQPYLDWAKENLSLNDKSPEEHYFCKGDTFHWLRRFAKQGRSFHGIILDPPTFSRDKDGKVFRVEKDYHRLVDLASQCLEPGGWILASTNCRKLSIREFQQEATLKLRKKHQVSALPMPEEYSGEAYLKSLWIDL
ncbi:class I SAM-dependent methyltransferase [Rubritalea marina]|uniref:class I SAM-dependent methyltransferase n=1 Tax=Rubritalea marina TaxID=361055 RepID=UPI00036387F1|nr:class I SAM-dependent methyltransferase [Rubritalea marina]